MSVKLERSQRALGVSTEMSTDDSSEEVSPIAERPDGVPIICDRLCDSPSSYSHSSFATGSHKSGCLPVSSRVFQLLGFLSLGWMRKARRADTRRSTAPTHAAAPEEREKGPETQPPGVLPALSPMIMVWLSSFPAPAPLRDATGSSTAAVTPSALAPEDVARHSKISVDTSRSPRRMEVSPVSYYNLEPNSSPHIPEAAESPSTN